MSNSSSRLPSNPDDLANDMLAANTATSGGESRASARYQAVLPLLNETPKITDEWFRLKEEEIQLRGHPDIKKSSCTDLVIDSREVAEAGEVDDLHVDQPNDDKKISSSDFDRFLMENDIKHLSRGQFPDEERISQHATQIGADDPKDYNLTVLTCDLPVPPCAWSTMNESDSLDPNKSKDETEIMRHLESTQSDVPHNRDFVDNLQPPRLNAGINAAICTLAIEDDESPPVPLRLRSHTQQDKQYLKEKAGFATPQSTHDMNPCLPLTYSIHFADAAVIKISSQIDSEASIQSKQLTHSIDETLAAPAVELDYPKKDKAILKQAVAQESRTQTEVEINYDLHDATHFHQEPSHLSLATSNGLSQPDPSELVQEEEENENVILIPEAFLVEANAPGEAARIEVAELIEPDQSIISLKKRYAFMVIVLIAASAIAVGIALNFRKGDRVSSDIAKATSTFLPSSRPIFVMPSLQPSLSRRYEIEKTFRQQNITFDEMDTTDDRLLALNWIIDKDPLKLNASSSNLVQRFILALLANAFSNLDWLSDSNECQWFGVECDNYGYIIGLNLSE